MEKLAPSIHLKPFFQIYSTCRETVCCDCHAFSEGKVRSCDTFSFWFFLRFLFDSFEAEILSRMTSPFFQFFLIVWLLSHAFCLLPYSWMPESGKMYIKEGMKWKDTKRDQSQKKENRVLVLFSKLSLSEEIQRRTRRQEEASWTRSVTLLLQLRRLIQLKRNMSVSPEKKDVIPLLRLHFILSLVVLTHFFIPLSPLNLSVHHSQWCLPFFGYHDTCRHFKRRRSETWRWFPLQ